MNILIGYVTNGVTSGVDKYILSVVNTLGNNHKIDLVTSGGRTVIDKIKNLEPKDSINVIHIPSLKHPVRQYKKFHKLFNADNYDAVYFNISEASNSIGILAAHNNKINKIIVHSHSSGIDESNFVYRIIRKTVHIAAKYTIIKKYVTDCVTCSDKATKWMFPKNMKLCSNIKMIYNTIDYSIYQYNKEIRKRTRKELEIDENILVLGFVGSLSYQKNIFFLIDILKDLTQKKKNVMLLLVGMGKDYERMQEYAKKSKTDKYTKFLGARTDVPNLLQAMDIFLLPSRFEGFPFVAVEAQMSGLVTLVSDHITKEIKITDRCKFINIDSTDKWIHAILGQEKYFREKFVIEDQYINAAQRQLELIEGLFH